MSSIPEPIRNIDDVSRLLFMYSGRIDGEIGCELAILSRRLDASIAELCPEIKKRWSVQCDHVWGIDGAHSNEYCKKCFIDKPKSEE